MVESYSSAGITRERIRTSSMPAALMLQKAPRFVRLLSQVVLAVRALSGLW